MLIAFLQKQKQWEAFRVCGIIKGDHPVGLTSEKLRRLSSLPMNWNKQRVALGFI